MLVVFALQSGASASCIDSETQQKHKLRLKAEKRKTSRPGAKALHTNQSGQILPFPNCLPIALGGNGREQNLQDSMSEEQVY